MALVHESFTVGTTPTLIVNLPEGNPATVVTVFNDANHTIYVGNATVATSGAAKGMPAYKDYIYVVTLNAEDKLYAIATTTSPANALTVVYSKVTN
jgi:hypothetical protein